MFLFEYMNLCGLPKKILNENQENLLLLKKTVADKRIKFYNNYNYLKPNIIPL